MTEKTNLIDALKTAETVYGSGLGVYIRCNAWSDNVWLKMTGFNKDETLYGTGIAFLDETITYTPENSEQGIDLGFKQFNVTLDNAFKDTWSVKRDKSEFEVSLNVEKLKFRLFNSEHIKEIICDIDKLAYNDDKPEYANAVEFFKMLKKLKNFQELKEKLEKYGD